MPADPERSPETETLHGTGRRFAPGELAEMQLEIVLAPDSQEPVRFSLIPGEFIGLENRFLLATSRDKEKGKVASTVLKPGDVERFGRHDTQTMSVLHDNAYVSRHHAVLEIGTDGSVTVEDDSLNGTDVTIRPLPERPR